MNSICLPSRVTHMETKYRYATLSRTYGRVCQPGPACRMRRLDPSAHSIGAASNPISLDDSTSAVLTVLSAGDCPDPTGAALRVCRGLPRAVAEMLRTVREEQQLTQNQLAVRMGTTQSIIARWETGDHEISMKNLARLAEALRVDIFLRFGASVGIR